MCLECGCGRPGPIRIDGKPDEETGSHVREHVHADGTRHTHDGGAHDHHHEGLGHDHAHASPAPRKQVVNESIFAANDLRARRNRETFHGLGLTVLNVVSSPGSGKTALLTRTIERLSPGARTAVVVGDLETDNDARRLRTTGAPVVQLSTGTLCHLDAEMVGRAAGKMDLSAVDFLVIENVGNLVCPAEFDLGEDLRVALLSVTEGEDKPLKYPPMFRKADVVLLTKTDLAEACEFDRAAAMANLGRVAPKARILEVSSKSGAGLDAWCDLLLAERAKRRSGP